MYLIKKTVIIITVHIAQTLYQALQQHSIKFANYHSFMLIALVTVNEKLIFKCCYSLDLIFFQFKPILNNNN